MAEHLGVIERESKRCGEIMRNLLTFARQSAPHREVTDLNTLVDRALKLVQHQLDLLQIELTKGLAENLPPVECDPGQIQQVILVLMVNATEAMAQGGRLAVSTECDQQTRTIAIRVADTGGGIPDEALAQIFEPFFTTKENQHRTGLGLAIAKNITEQHGGSLRVESTSPQGTVFCVRVPLGSNGAKA